MNKIEVTIIIATFNSEKVLPLALEAIKKQTFPKEHLEVIIVDGGSSDNTIELATLYGCVILNNPKTEPVNAKLIGIQNAKGRYVITIDHDEVMVNPNSILLKYKVMKTHPECKCVLTSGYRRPPNYPLLNQYISEFGDPFSLYMYSFSKDSDFFEKTLRRYYTVLEDAKDYCVVSFENIIRKQPIMELCCMGTMIDKEYFSKFQGAYTNGAIYVHLFYLMLKDQKYRIVIIKNDPLLHYSVDSLKAYLPKLKWRICNNVHFKENAESGFAGRVRYQPKINLKKYLFIPYTFTIILPFIQSAYLSIKRKNQVYLIHTILSLYVAIQIIYQMIKNVLSLSPQFTSYDGKKILK